ncbi:MAG: hypothetical protein WCD47_06860 [Candidatus Sulfotelmatobacter sp.]
MPKQKLKDKKKNVGNSRTQSEAPGQVSIQGTRHFWLSPESGTAG